MALIPLSGEREGLFPARCIPGKAISPFEVKSVKSGRCVRAPFMGRKKSEKTPTKIAESAPFIPGE